MKSQPMQQESKETHQIETKKYTNTTKSKVGITYKVIGSAVFLYMIKCNIFIHFGKPVTFL